MFLIRSVWGKTSFVAICLLAAWLYVSRVVRVYLADRLADPYRVASLERAAQLFPDDAELAHMLGLRYAESLPDADRALSFLKKAATLQPLSGQYWLDLASAYQVEGKVSEQNQAVAAALEAEPHDPDIASEAAEYYLLEGETPRALPLFRQAMEQDPAAAADLLQVCWRATHDVNLLLSQAVPGKPDALLAFLGLLTQQGETDAARQVWLRLLADSHPFEVRQSLFYFDYLIAKHQVTDLAASWAGLQTRLSSAEASPRPSPKTPRSGS